MFRDFSDSSSLLDARTFASRDLRINVLSLGIYFLAAGSFQAEMPNVPGWDLMVDCSETGGIYGWCEFDERGDELWEIARDMRRLLPGLFVAQGGTGKFLLYACTVNTSQLRFLVNALR